MFYGGIESNHGKEIDYDSAVNCGLVCSIILIICSLDIVTRLVFLQEFSILEGTKTKNNTFISSVRTNNKINISLT